MRASTIHAAVSGFPRIGDRRQLKTATERYWAGDASLDDLAAAAADIRAANRHTLRSSGIDILPVNDFSLYDHVLDTAVLVGAVPARYKAAGLSELDTYFAMARGHQRGGIDLAPLEMTKWFDTNYHYLVPEIGPETPFSLSATKPLGELDEATSDGDRAKVVLLGPVTFLLLAKPAENGDVDPLARLDELLGVYEAALESLAAGGASWVQLDEPAFAMDRTAAELDALGRAYDRLASVAGRPRLMVATYFDAAHEAVPVLLDTAVDGLALDLVRGQGDLDRLGLAGGLPGRTLAAGVVDGRNVWINDFADSLALLERAAELCEELVVTTSCSLQHVPLTLVGEEGIDDEVRPWLAFATEKAVEVATLARGVREGTDAIAAELAANRSAHERRSRSALTGRAAVRSRLDGLRASDYRRPAPRAERSVEQSRRLPLPALPTTTIGSFPQTPELRAARRSLGRGRITAAEYDAVIEAEIASVIELQESLGLDVLVHGEPERNDMVQYFAEQLDGFAVTASGWVQSYGTRYTRPPIIVGDVARRRAMTVRWATTAQSLTALPVKGMLTGPVTLLLWSFPRDDQPLGTTAAQLALAIRDEVADLGAAGVPIIQVDEPAIREGLPLRGDRRGEYLQWAVDAFRLATAVAPAGTQVHTHMCYSEFGEILPAIEALDADVVSIEAARSRMDLLDAVSGEGGGLVVGPGVYDIHAPRVPSIGEMVELLERAVERLGAERLWVNPDCGLKTRSYAEVEPALRNMVDAARQVRAALNETAR